jgi:Zn-dependent protease with chaperone function
VIRRTARPRTTSREPGRAATPQPRLSEQELFAAFAGSFQWPPPTLAYRTALIVVAAALIVLPLVYLSCIVLVGYGIYYHARSHTELLSMGRGLAHLIFLALYAAPLAAGPVTVLSMVKPLVARPSRRESHRSLVRQNEPLLFAFLDRICEVIGAPRPTRIDITCDASAAAGFQRGILSIFQSKLVLTIGLPLAAGLTLREFGGVLAHELGHFAKGSGMRLSYLIRSIVNWFTRKVYESDQWDDWFNEMVHRLHGSISWVFVAAQLFVMIGRGILWGLLQVALALSGGMLRRMEFDADRYQARFAGSDVFAVTHHKIRLLFGAWLLAQRQLSASVDQRKLVDNLPGFIAYHARRASPEVRPSIHELIIGSTTRWFDSHPCDKDRISAVERLHSPGIFQMERPATELFRDFDAQAAAATWNLYCADFGSNVRRPALQPLHEFVTSHGK